jgi:hypothetical protein
MTPNGPKTWTQENVYICLDEKSYCETETEYAIKCVIYISVSIAIVLFLLGILLVQKIRYWRQWQEINEVKALPEYDQYKQLLEREEVLKEDINIKTTEKSPTTFNTAINRSSKDSSGSLLSSIMSKISKRDSK